MKRSPLIHKEKVKIVGSILRSAATDWQAGAIIIFAATQLSYHWWPESAFVYGLRIDYLSPTLYFLDILLITHVWIKQVRRDSDIGNWKGWTIIAPLLLANLVFSVNPLATLNWSLHCLLYLAFARALSENFIKSKLQYFLIPAMLIQIAIGLGQVIKGGSLNGIMYWLGERMHSVSSPNAAKSDIFGELILRAYGTFSHPNILAGWLVLCVLILIHVGRGRKLILPLIITIVGIMVTGSRAAALALFGIVIPFKLIHSPRHRLLYFGCIAVLIGIVWGTGALTRAIDLSISERLSLQRVSASVIQAYPLFGTGANASITAYPTLAPNFRLLQPDHNSATLILSWFGLAGIVAIIYLTHRSSVSQWSWLIPLLPLVLLDHYLITSPQGFLMTLIYLRVYSLVYTNS